MTHPEDQEARAMAAVARWAIEANDRETLVWLASLHIPERARRAAERAASPPKSSPEQPERPESEVSPPEQPDEDAEVSPKVDTVGGW